MKIVPCSYYPTTVVLLDDSQAFLSDLTDNLSDADFKCQAFISPTETLNYLNQYANSAKTLFSQYKTTEYDIDKTMAQVDIFSFHKEVYNQKRFESPIVIIVDYSMPQMSGVNFCQELVDLPFKKIMLTGEAEDDLAVEAFNQGYINGFVKKSASDYLAKIKEQIIKLNHEYFLEHSNKIIEATDDSLKQTLHNNAFYEFFKNILKERNILEYYLLNDAGSFLLLDMDARPSWLVVQTEDAIKEYYNLAKNEKDVPTIMLQLLQERKRIPCFPKLQGQHADPKFWPTYPATRLENTSIYYSLVDQLDDYELEQNKIMSYQQFLETTN